MPQRALKYLLACWVLFAGFSGQAQLLFLDVSTGAPIEAVEVLAAQGEQKIFLVSTADGTVRLPGSGTWQCTATHTAFKTRFFEYVSGLELLIRLEPMVERFNEVVITGQYSNVGTKDAVQNVRVINSDRINEMAAIDMRDLMIRELNIDIGEDRVLGTNMQMAGLAGDKVKVLINGIPVVGRVNGNIDLNQINLNQVERVEVVQGPMSVEYGTDALAGTINIITRKQINPGLQVNVGGQYETNGRINGSVNASYAWGKNQVKIDLGRKYFDGFSVNDSDRTDYWKPKDQQMAGLSYSRLFDWGRVSLNTSLFDELITNKGSLQNRVEEVVVNDSISDFYRYYFAQDEYYRTTRSDNNISWTHSKKENRSFKGHVAYNYYQRLRNTYIKEFADLSESLVDFEDAQDTTDFRLINSRMTWVEGVNDKIKFSVGLEAQHETAVGKRIKDQSQSVTDLSLFGSTEYEPLKGLVIRPGLRYTYNSTYDAPLIPSLHTKYGWGNWAIRASFGRGFRSPNLKDLFFFFVDSNHNIQGNLDLKAETSDNYQFSISHYAEWENWALSPSVRVFHNDVQNLIDLALVDGDSQLYQNINISEAKTQGINAEVQLTSHHWTLSGGWAYTGITGTFGGQDELPDYQYYSQISFKTSYSFPEVGVVLSSNAKYTSEQQSFLLEGDTLSRVSTESFTLLDAFVSKDLFDKKLNLAVGVKNLLGVTDVTSLVASGAAHGSSSNTPIGTGRNLVFRLNYQWRK